MRSIRRVLAATAAGVAMTAASIAVAGPAAASPEDGKGCAGFPAVPASYVCIISATPANALPTTTTSYIPVTVPAACYVADCTDPTTVQVPVPGAGLNNGDVAVLWYQGTHYPIGVALGGQVLTLAQDTIRLVGNTVNGVLQDLPTTTELLQAVVRAVQPYLDLVNRVLDGAVDDVNQAIASLPTTTEILQDLARELRPWIEFANDTIDGLPTSGELVDAAVEVLRPYVLAVVAWVEAVQGVVGDLPTTQEIFRAIEETDWVYTAQQLALFVLELILGDA